VAATDARNKREKPIGRALAAAACALLGRAGTASAADEPSAWSLDTAMLLYKESDSRVQDLSVAVSAIRDFGDQRLLGLSLTADTLTGASASGAIALDKPQTFTSPSGKATYSTPANEIPLDDTFKDTRFAASASWTQPLGRLYTGSAGLSVSGEYDYQHLGGNVSLARDFNKRNTTLSGGVAYSRDDIDPVGGAPTPLSQMPDVGVDFSKTGKQSKDVLDLLVGATQVLGRSTVVRVNYSYSRASGYLNDPYKFLSVVDPTTGDTIAHTPSAGLAGPDGVFLFESRPDSRTKQSVYAEMKHAFGRPVLELSYRYMTDDWNIDSHTLDGRLRWPLGASGYLEPHLRYYTQTAASFYRSSVPLGQSLPTYASSDFRLGQFDGVTAGIKYGFTSDSGSEWSARFEYYQQTGNVPDSMLIGNQLNREQFPDLKAIFLQLGYRFSL